MPGFPDAANGHPTGAVQQELYRGDETVVEARPQGSHRLGLGLQDIPSKGQYSLGIGTGLAGGSDG
jgi:hypothetical protein